MTRHVRSKGARKRTVATIFVLMVACFVTLAVWIYSRLWMRVSAMVYANGTRVAGSRVYVAMDGRTLIDLSGNVYLVNGYRSHGPRICDANLDINIEEFSFFRWIAFTEHNSEDVPCEAMPGLEVQYAPNLLVQRKYITFTDDKNERVRVAF